MELHVGSALHQLRPEPAGEPGARKQFRHRRRGAPSLAPNPKLSAELRAKYMQPIVPWTMYAVELAPSATVEFGLVSVEDMEGYAAHCETGVPWYVSLGPFLVRLAPASASDPLFRRARGSHMVPKPLRAPQREAFAPKPIIALIDRQQLRAKYEDIARRYLTGAVRRTWHG